MQLLHQDCKDAEKETEQGPRLPNTRDLTAERQAIERAISKQSPASREYLSGKFSAS